MFVICIKTSHETGMGHLFRMINLSKFLKGRQKEFIFILLGEHVPSEAFLKKESINYKIVDQNEPEWEKTVVQHYQPTVWINDRMDTSEAHSLILMALGCKIVTFDDNGSGAKYTHLNISALAIARKEEPEGLNVLIGLDYLLLSDEINYYLRLRRTANNWVVNFGGSDTYGVTVKAVEWLVKKKRTATVILGPGFLHHKILETVMGNNITIKQSVPSLIAEFSNYDVAITGGGLTAFEAAAAGLPTVTVANELHEIGHCEYLQNLGCSIYAGYHNQVNFDVIEKINNIQEMSQAGIDNVTTKGINNICKEIFKLAS